MRCFWIEPTHLFCLRMSWYTTARRELRTLPNAQPGAFYETCKILTVLTEKV